MLIPSFCAALPAMTPPRRIFMCCISSMEVMGDTERMPDSEGLVTSGKYSMLYWPYISL